MTPAFTQDTVQKNMTVYVDTSNGFSFCIPNWFSVKKSTEYYDALDVMESGEFSFRIFINNLAEFNHRHEARFNKSFEDSVDVFLDVAKEATYWSHFVGYHGEIERYGQLDSLREFRSKGGQRVYAIYRTLISPNNKPIDHDSIGPLFIVDLPNKNERKFVEFDYSWFDVKRESYKELAFSIALSVQQR
jgi:hypothetical protein